MVARHYGRLLWQTFPGKFTKSGSALLTMASPEEPLSRLFSDFLQEGLGHKGLIGVALPLISVYPGSMV